MTRKKRKHPHRHTGKLVPLRTAEEIKAEIEAARKSENTNERPSLNVWREMIQQVVDAEVALLENEEDREAYLERTAVLAECLAWLDQIQQRYLHDNNGNPIDVKHSDATFLAYNAIRIGYLFGQASARVALEAAAVEGIEQSDRGHKLAAQQRGSAFSISREDLLDKCRTMYRRHKCNQKELADHVATGLPIKGERVRQLMRDHKIYKADYAR